MAKNLEFLSLPAPDRKTAIWAVCSVQGGQNLGEVKWFAHWRRYTFWPAVGTIYDESCMREIADFVEAETKKRKAAF